MTGLSTQYRPDIDGLRAVAVVAVVAFHAFPTLLPGGFVGVDVFFVISGYLITGIILGGLQAGHFSFQGLLRPPHSPNFSGACCRTGRRARDRLVLSVRRRLSGARPACRGRDGVLFEPAVLAGDELLRSGRRAQTVAALVVARHRGAVLPRVAGAVGADLSMGAWPAAPDAAARRRVIHYRDPDGARRSHRGVLCAVDSILGAAGGGRAGLRAKRCTSQSSHQRGGVTPVGCEYALGGRHFDARGRRDTDRRAAHLSRVSGSCCPSRARCCC